MLREFYRLCETDATDDDMIEHDNSTLEAAYELLDAGLRDTQLLLIRYGLGGHFQATTAALSFTGSDPDRYATLPADFLRMNGDHRRSALRSAAGVRWGREIMPGQRHDFTGNCWYVRGASGDAGLMRLYVTTGASVPSGTRADYYFRHADLADSTVDIPEDERPLIPAYAAVRATAYPWYAGGDTGKARLEAYLRFLKNQTWHRSRTSRQPKMATVHPVTGDRWIV